MQEKGHSTHVVVIALLALLVLVCSVSADARQTISSVRITSSAENAQIVVKAGSAVSITAAQLSKHLVFDVQGHLNNDQIRQVKVNSGDIGIIKCGWYKPSPPVARIAIAVSSKRPYTIKYSSDKRQATITVAKRGFESALTAKPPAPAAKPAPKPAKAVAPKVEKPPTPVLAVEAEPETCSTVTPVEVVQTPVAEPVAVVQTPAPEPVEVEQKPAPEPVAVVHKPVLIASTRPIAVHSTAIESAPAVTPGNRVSLDFVGTDIQDVLKALALQSNSNIVASPEVKGEVTVALNNVTVDEALKLVTNLSGFKFQEVGGTYVVGTAGNLESLANGAAPPEAGLNRVADVAMIRHADPTMLSKMLAAQFKGIDVSNAPVSDAKNAAPNGTTMLVLSGTAEQVASAKTLVAQVENSLANNAAATEMDLYEVKYADILELAAVLAAYVPGLRVNLGPNQGFNLDSPAALAMGNGSDSGSGSGSSGSRSSDDKNVAPPKVLMLQGSAAEIAKAKDFLAKIDVQQPQIVIEAKVLDIRNDDSKNLGIEWSWNDVEFSELEKSPQKEPTAITLGKFNRWPETIIAKVNALVTAGKAKVLANPSVSALEGKPASIFIGDEFKYVINIQQTPTGVNVTTETARVGVQLHAICRVSSDGYITMDLHPEVSVITDFIELPQVGLSLPEISRRYVDSTIRIKDGETIVIGGLIKDQDIETMSGVPILKDLPLIGGLFRSRETQKEHSEIMMFITPRILTNGP